MGRTGGMQPLIPRGGRRGHQLARAARLRENSAEWSPPARSRCTARSERARRRRASSREGVASAMQGGGAAAWRARARTVRGSGAQPHPGVRRSVQCCGSELGSQSATRATHHSWVKHQLALESEASAQISACEHGASFVSNFVRKNVREPVRSVQRLSTQSFCSRNKGIAWVVGS